MSSPTNLIIENENMKTHRQMTVCISLGEFNLVAGRSRISVKKGDRFAIVNSQTDQINTGAYEICREKKAVVGGGKYIFPSLFDKNFQIVDA